MRFNIDPVRVLAYGSFFGAMITWSIVNPAQMSAVAEEPVKAAAATLDKLFPNLIDPKMFKRYDITFDDSVSGDVVSTRHVKKIAGGRTVDVTITTTPSGTYSTDGVLSPHVKYPGVEKKLKPWAGPSSSYWYRSSRSASGSSWSMYSHGSFTYFSYGVSTRT
jgi:hypothetical protein